MADTTKPGDIHGHPIMECGIPNHEAAKEHLHPVSGPIWEDGCHRWFLRPDSPTPEPWAGHPVKWCEEHDSLTEAQDEICDRSWEHTCATGGSQGPCDWQTYQPWVDLLAERDEARKELVALRVLDGASAERAEAERKAMAQQRDDACRERKQYKRAANEARRQRNQAREALAKVREAAGRHPECGKHPKGDPIKCGWKLAVQDIQAALEACDE